MKFTKPILILLAVFLSSPNLLAEVEHPFFVGERAKMIEYIKAAGIKNQLVIDAMSKVPRQEFVPEPKKAYHVRGFKLGDWQALQAPYVSALIFEALNLKPGEKVLEIGTGTGYDAVLMADIGTDVYTIEIEPQIADDARVRLKRLGYNDIKVKTGDGFFGWEEYAPFDAIVLELQLEKFPQALVDQLKDNGRMILTMGELYGSQMLVYAWKENGKMKTRPLSTVKSPPMRGKILEE